MFGGTRFKRALFRQCITVVLFVAYLTGFIEPFARFFTPYVAEAAQVTIDANASANGTSHIFTGNQLVFTDDQTGYKFFRDLDGTCVYRKTTNGGTSWGATTTVDAQTDCVSISVWYDRWTPGIASTSIHISTLDTGNDDIWYNRLDTNGDTLLLGSSPVSMLTGSGQGGTTLTEGENFTAITRATDGTLYAISNDGSGVSNDSFVVECTVTCSTAGNWTERTVLPLDVASDQNILVPLTGGDIMIIQRDISADDMRSRIWDESAGSWLAWVTIDAAAPENATYDGGFAAVVSSTTPGQVYLAYSADTATLGTDDDVRTAFYNGSTWSLTGSVILNSATRAVTGVAIGLDAANNDVYVAYSARTTAGTAGTGNIYYKWATSSMQNWSAEVGPINSSADDMYGVDMSSVSDQRVYATWFDGTDDDVLGDTVADIFPGVHASATGAQATSTNASTTNVYLGGTLLIYNTYGSFDMTGISLTESGTVDGSTALSNIKILYEMDTTAPYNCASVSYNGTESQFGSTDTNGFSGANGVSSFTGTTVNLSTTTAFCGYIVLDVLDSAVSNATIDIGINNPTSDITVTNSTAGPATAVGPTDTTLIFNDTPTLTHFHWRNDDGTEVTATSKTGGTEDTALTSMRQGSTTRLRIGVSNEGSTSTPLMQYRIEYALNSSTCDVATGWTDVGAVGGDFDMAPSANLTDGGDTTNIAVASGGVTDENTTFLTPNGAIRDTSSQTDQLRLTPTQFLELEYSIVASTSVTEGNTYCFRVSDQGYPLYTYTNYPRASIASDVLVTIATSSAQVTSTSTPKTSFYVGSYFAVTENTASRNVTSITIAENGTIDAQNHLDNIRLYYDLDITAPYNCGSESYSGSESLFGTSDTDGFSGANGTSTFTGSVAISTTTTMCLYTVVDITSGAQNGETINVIIENPSQNLLVSGGGTVSPTITRDMNGSTSIIGPVLTQTHYHWRNDNGTEATATSRTGGTEDTPVTNVAQTTPVRLRMQISNEGSVTSTPATYQLEYGTKISTCSAVSAWTNVDDVGGAFDMFNSTNLTDGGDTTNIAVASGGVTDENVTFLTPNASIKDTSSVISSISIGDTRFLEAEFSLQQTTQAGFDVTYCFRLSQAGTALNAYTRYAELTTSPERDFEIQRGTATLTGTSVTLTAGVDYTAPSASTSAFMRITNSHHTGAGSTAAGTQNSDDVTAYLVNPANIMTSVTIGRPSTATGNTRVSWEIVEFIGSPGSDNEMIVRSQTAVTYGTTATSATGTTVSGVTDDANVVVFITGQLNPDIGAANYNTGQSTSEWSGGTDVPVFSRGNNGADASIVSYAVVEFTGINWIVQRAQHTYTSAGITETESINAVNSLSRTFLHTQKRNDTALVGTDEFGHEVWLSSVGFVSFFLESGATTPSGQTSVAWVIENIQTTSGAMDVTPSNGSSNGGTEPLTISIAIGKTLSDITNTSIFVNSRSAGTGNLYPRPIVGATIASTTHYELWRSDTGANMTYRTEVVEWPTAGLSLRQNNYQFFVDNNQLLPADPWPEGGLDLGENTVLTAGDDPLGEGDRIRIRMSVRTANATLPTSTVAFKLQYAPLSTSCSAVSADAWTTLGNSASSTIWRGYSATGTTDGTVLSGTPSTPSDLLLSESTVAGTLEEENDSAPNPYAVPEGTDVEYDWIVEQNGANAETFYCFRMVESDGTALDIYFQHPQLRTASFTPRTQNWRWFNDEQNLTPTSSLAAENVAPINIVDTQVIALRITVAETKNIARNDVRFKLQFSEYADFSTSTDVVATSSCVASSTWCYADGAGIDNEVVSSTTLTDTDSCVSGVGDGCGTYNEMPDYKTGFRHENGARAEYSFIVRSASPQVNAVYYFRLYDLVQNIPVATNEGEVYPSLVTEGATLTFGIQGVASSTVVEGVTADITSTAVAIPYGALTLNADLEAAQRLQVTTNAPEGYQIYMTTSSDLINSSGDVIAPIGPTNAAPDAWSTGCAVSAQGCFGYHAGDDTLEGGSTRFAATDTYARFSTTTLDEISYGAGPVTNETTDVVFKIKARSLQEAGEYTTGVRYIAVPVF